MLPFADISATSFFKPVSVIKFVEEYLNMRDTSRPLSDRDRVKVMFLHTDNLESFLYSTSSYWLFFVE